MAAKTAFLLASYQLRVSEDWVVADAAKRNRSPSLNSLLTGKRTGNFPDFELLAASQGLKKPCTAITSGHNSLSQLTGKIFNKTGNC